MLGEIGDERAVRPLVAALQDGNPGVRKGAAQGIDLMGAEQTVEPLLEVLLNRAEDATVRRDAAHTLGRLGAKRAVRPLIDVLNNPNEPRPVREGAAGALEMIDSPEGKAAAEKYRAQTAGR